MAYFVGPLLGGEISQYIGFKWLMSVIGLANISYGIYLMRTVLFAFQPEVNRTFFPLLSKAEKRARILTITTCLSVYVQGYSDRESPEANNKFFLRLWPSNTTLSSNSSYKRFYDAVDKPSVVDSK